MIAVTNPRTGGAVANPFTADGRRPLIIVFNEGDTSSLLQLVFGGSMSGQITLPLGESGSQARRGQS